jgi:hypothetical protein
MEREDDYSDESMDESGEASEAVQDERVRALIEALNQDPYDFVKY